MTVSLANGGAAEKRRALDFYPTPPEVTRALLDFWALPRGCVVWEPACGDGAMARVLEAAGHRVVPTELRQDGGYGRGGVDFLNCPPIACEAIVTNPPFNLSEAFIRRALELAPRVAMVLKSQYWHAARRLQLFVDCPPSYVLPLTWRPDFMAGERGGAPTMEVLWTVWERDRISPCEYHLLKRPPPSKAQGDLLEAA